MIIFGFLKNSVNLTRSKAIGLGELLEIFLNFEVRLGILSMNKPQYTRSFMFLEPSIGSSDNIWLLKNSV